jgi:hypothetical protein
MSVKEVRRRHMKLAGGGKMKRKAGTGAWVEKMKPPSVESNEDTTRLECVRED